MRFVIFVTFETEVKVETEVSVRVFVPALVLTRLCRFLSPDLSLLAPPSLPLQAIITLISPSRPFVACLTAGPRA